MTKHCKNKWFWVLVVSCTICLYWIGTGLYWEYGNFKPMIIYSITPTTDEVCAGQFLYYTVDLEKNMNVSCIIDREMVNSYRIQYDPVRPTSTTLGRRPVPARLYIPRGTDPDDWIIRAKWTCYVGPNKREIIVGGESKPVKVIDCEKNKGDKGDKGDRGPKGDKGTNFWGK